MKTALITGVAGFCGRHMARRLAQQGGYRVVGLDLSAQTPPGVPLDQYLSADLSRPQDVDAVIVQARPDYVYHLVGLASGPPGEVYRVNLMTGICLLDSIGRLAPTARVLMVGSAAEYGAATGDEMPLDEQSPCRPAGPYGLSKYGQTLAALDCARRSGLRVVVARPFNIIGAGVPAALVVGALIQRAKQVLAAGHAEAEITVGNLDTERDFVAVEDVVQGYLAMVEDGPWGEVFNLCSGQPRSIRSVAETLLSFSVRPVRLRVDPALVRPSDVPTSYGSWRKANHCFGFQPTTPLDEALRAAWEHVMGGAAQ